MQQEIEHRTPEEEERYKRAQVRVRAIRNFYSNVVTFVWVNILLLIINLVFSPRSLWFYWVTIIWGIVLLVQAFRLFTIKDRLLGEEWEKRKIKEMMDKEKNRTNNK